MNSPYNFNTSKSDSSSPPNETTAAQLAVLGGFLSTLGDTISTYAAVLALEELQQTQNNNNANNDKISEMEKQIKYLTKEINQRKKDRNRKTL